MNGPSPTFWAVIGGILVSALVIFGLWEGYWWLAGQNVQHQRDINHSSQQYQDGLISQERDRAQAYNIATDPAQKKQFADTFCSVYFDIVDVPNDLLSAHSTICTGR